MVLEELLRAVRDGQRSFEPESSSAEDMDAFQPVAKALVFAMAEGYLENCRPHYESMSGNDWCDCVVIRGGLSHQGAVFLARRSPESEARFDGKSGSISGDLDEPQLSLLGAPKVTDRLSLFISHSGVDAPMAKLLVALFQRALGLSARSIRCTSVDGYRLSAGANTNDVLRQEVFDAQVVIALLTPSSLGSTYVLFELGARWASKRHLFPVLSAGVKPADLKAPLSSLNALSAEIEAQVRQLVEDVANALSKSLEPMASFSDEVEELVASAVEPSGTELANVSTSNDVFVEYRGAKFKRMRSGGFEPAAYCSSCEVGLASIRGSRLPYICTKCNASAGFTSGELRAVLSEVRAEFS